MNSQYLILRQLCRDSIQSSRQLKASNMRLFWRKLRLSYLNRRWRHIWFIGYCLDDRNQWRSHGCSMQSYQSKPPDPKLSCMVFVNVAPNLETITISESFEVQTSQPQAAPICAGLRLSSSTHYTPPVATSMRKLSQFTKSHRDNF